MRSRPHVRRLLAAALTVAAGACLPSAAHADVLPVGTGTPLGLASAGTGPGGVRHYSGMATGVTNGTAPQPLDVNVALPAAPSPLSAGGSYPLIIVLHGYGGSKKDFGSHEEAYIPTADQWAQRGYAVLNMTDRGFANSCGNPQSRVANGQACAQGWIKLMDTRFEVGDAQSLAGQLADGGWIDPQRIGATGESYGGGASIMLGTLKDRMMDASSSKLVPWVSPTRHLPMRIAGAVPFIPWSDLISSLVPNGHDLDYTLATADQNSSPVGVEKQSFVSGLFATGQVSTSAVTVPPGQPVNGYYAPPGADPGADLNSWFTTINAGEPYDGNPAIENIINLFKEYRGAFYVLRGGLPAPNAGPDTTAPAPMLLSSGFTDDLFPADETLRYYNLERTLFPGTPISLIYADYGHQRGANGGNGKPAETAYLSDHLVAWMDHFVRGDGADPGSYVTAFTQTCPTTVPAGGPFTGPDWFSLHPGQLLLSAAPGAQTIASGAGNPQDAQVTDPVLAGNNSCGTDSDPGAQPGAAYYRFRPATGAGYTMLGFPLVQANLSVTGAFPEIAERLWDVAPDGTRTLVAHGVYRPDDTTAFPRQVFELHANGWHFAAGHAPELELLGQDPPYVRKSNGAFQIAVSNLSLTLPTIETSGNGITPARPLPLPLGAQSARGAKTTRSDVGGGSARPVACRSVAAAVRHATVRPRGRGLRFGLPRGAHVTVDVFQASHGRRTYSFRPIAHFANRRRSFTWSGRRGTDGVYVVRFRSGRDQRRTALDRHHGRFRRRPGFDDEETCGSLAFFRLDYPVFGGRRNHRLFITYRLREDARVTVRAYVGRHRIRLWRAQRVRATHVIRLVLRPRGVRRGDVRIELSARPGKRSVVRELTSRRL